LRTEKVEGMTIENVGDFVDDLLDQQFENGNQI
jgi:hypothetical protein